MKLRVVSATLDASGFTMYLESGNTHFIPQGDKNLSRLIGEVLPVVANGGTAEVESEQDEPSIFQQFSELAKGIVKFMTVTNERLSNAENMISNILANSPQLTYPKKGETIVAVVETESDPVIVTGVEHLEGQISNAVERKEPIGVINFMKRLAALKGKRKHSAEDLLKFVKAAKLQIADNGDIIAFKALSKTKEGDYVDIHSNTVRQRVGTKVYMDERMVDPNRLNDCSTGLHIASVKYLSSFRGSVCTLVQVRPEDCIAVPELNATKMRVCAYVILAELSAKDYGSLLGTDVDVISIPGIADLLSKYLSGAYYKYDNTAFVEGPREVHYTDLTAIAEQKETEIAVVELAPVKDHEEINKAKPVNVRDVAKTIKTTKALTKDQKKILDLIAKGMTITEVSKKTGYARSTIYDLVKRNSK